MLTVSSNSWVAGSVCARCARNARHTLASGSGRSGCEPTAVVCAVLGRSSGCWPRRTWCSAASSPSASAATCLCPSRRTALPRRRRPPRVQVSDPSQLGGHLSWPFINDRRRAAADAYITPFGTGVLVHPGTTTGLTRPCNFDGRPCPGPDRCPVLNHSRLL